jgi:hypothetical protein
MDQIASLDRHLTHEVEVEADQFALEREPHAVDQESAGTVALGVVSADGITHGLDDHRHPQFGFRADLSHMA